MVAADLKLKKKRKKLYASSFSIFHFRMILSYRYLECGSADRVAGSSSQSVQVSSCLEKLLCLIHDPSVHISKLEKSVANM